MSQSYSCYNRDNCCSLLWLHIEWASGTTDCHAVLETPIVCDLPMYLPGNASCLAILFYLVSCKCCKCIDHHIFLNHLLHSLQSPLCLLYVSFKDQYSFSYSTHFYRALTLCSNTFASVLKGQHQEKEKQLWLLPSRNLQSSDGLCFSLVPVIQARTDIPCTPCETCMVSISPA